MSNIIRMDGSRRAFLKKAGALSLAGVATPWAINLAAMAEASAANATDYKATVCIFLYGGNDYGNTLVPYDNANYALYNQLRPTLCYPSQFDLDRTGADSRACGFGRR